MVENKWKLFKNTKQTNKNHHQTNTPLQKKPKSKHNETNINQPWSQGRKGLYFTPVLCYVEGLNVACKLI